MFSAPLAAEEFKPLWNGKDFTGFSFHLGMEGTDNEGTFTIKDGVIVCTGEPKGYFFTDKSYDRYVLEYDWKFARPKGLENDLDFKGNSGCLIHIKEAKALRFWPRSIEIQGMYVQAGRILPIPRNVKCQYTWDEKAAKEAVTKVGDWHTTRIEVDGGNMKIFVNGTEVSSVKDCEITEGPIGFQSEGAEIHFRNIRLAEKK